MDLDGLRAADSASIGLDPALMTWDQLQRSYSVVMDRGLGCSRSAASSSAAAPAPRGTGQREEKKQPFPQSFDEMVVLYKSPEKVPAHLQRSIVSVMESQQIANVRGMWTDAWKARALSASQRNASRYLTLIPSDERHYLSDNEMRLACRVRFGLPLIPSLPPDTRCLCVERKDDPRSARRLLSTLPEEHVLTCGSLRHHTRNSGHAMGVNAIASLAHSAGVPIIVSHRSSMAPTDHLTPDFSFEFIGKRVTSDWTMAHPVAQSYQKQSSHKPLFAAHRLESAKHRKYDAWVRREGREFISFSVETLGGFGTEATQIIDLLATDAVRNDMAADRSQFKNKAYNLLSIAIARGVAETIRLGSLIFRGAHSATAYASAGRNIHSHSSHSSHSSHH
jgi:hypothetical protein